MHIWANLSDFDDPMVNYIRYYTKHHLHRQIFITESFKLIYQFARDKKKDCLFKQSLFHLLIVQICQLLSELQFQSHQRCC